MNNWDKLLNLSTHDLWNKIQQDSETLTMLIEASYNQINKYESKINALTFLVEKENLTTNDGGLLLGMPVLVKDTFETVGIPSTAGSLKYKEAIPDQNAEIVEQIINSGGNLLAKTNTPEFAMDYQSFNELYGVTNNPFDLERTPGGSSGGSSAGVAMQYSPFAIGSDLGGSLRQPASFCGVYSLRPTQGILSDHGHIPPIAPDVNNTMATFGPIAKDLFGLKLLWYSIIGGEEMIWNDKQSNKMTDISIKAFSSIEGLNIDLRITNLMKQIFNKWEKKGSNLKISTEYLDFERTQIAYMGLFHHLMGQDGKNEFDLKYYVSMQNDVREQQLGILDGFDLWILPVTSLLPYKHNLNHNDFQITDEGSIIHQEGVKSINSMNYWTANGIYSRPISVSGFPTITLPIGMIEGLPVGVQVVAKPNQEEKLFDFTQILDDNLGNRISPPSLLNI